MLLGIDVGGTYTDAALYEAGKILKTSKFPTRPDNLQTSLINAITSLLSAGEAAGKTLQRIVIGTTVVTNLLATGRELPTALILMPGHSLPPGSYRICPHQYFISGMVDFRGRVVEEIEESELDDCLGWLKKNGFTRIAIAGKFSNRNPVQELEAARYIQNALPGATLVLSHQISARLNFPRRAVTAYYTAMVKQPWADFSTALQQALDQLNIQCEVHILKADGGTLPLAAMLDAPCETIFSGPAASVMGALALHPQSGNAVVVDVGGTTSDLALIVGSQPLYASRGAVINDQPTQIDAFSVNSVPLGGDSLIETENGLPVIRPYRQGAAVCFGGSALTLTDIMNVRYTLQLGDAAASARAVKTFSDGAGLLPETLCCQIEQQAVDQLEKQIHHMMRLWETEPAYKVWEVVHRQPFTIQKLIGIGAGAPLVLPQLAKRLGVPLEMSPYAPSANAVGAALVRLTLRVTLHADTATKKYTLSPPTVTDTLPRSQMQLEQVKEMAARHLKELCTAQQINLPEETFAFYLTEQFNVISGWGEDSGRIFDVGVQIPPGFIEDFTGVIE